MKLSLFACVTLLLAGSAAAQTTNATIVGDVTDPRRAHRRRGDQSHELSYWIRVR